MGPKGFITSFVNLVAIFLLLHSIPLTTSQEVEDNHEFNYVVGSKHGPQEWGSIHKNWSACSTGRMQSPVDISTERTEVSHQLGKLHRRHRPAEATMHNRGHDIELKWAEGAGALWLNGTEYVLHQYHWHSPSEHTINGKRFNLEMHMVHKSADGKIAVVGFLFKLGRPDAFLAKMEKYILGVKDVKNGEEHVGIVDPRLVKMGTSKYFRYTGSLTSPPCTEGVVWSIMNKVKTVSEEQLKLLRDAVNDGMENNARPTQEVNGRVIKFYRPTKVHH